MGEKYFDLTHPGASDIFDVLLDAWFGDGIRNQSDILVHRLLDITERTAKSAMVHSTEEDKNQQGDNTDAFENLCQKLLGISSSAVARSVQYNVAKNEYGIPLD